MDSYIKLFDDSFEKYKGFFNSDATRLEFIGSEIFNICTYDTQLDESFGFKCLEVAHAIANRYTFRFIEDKERYEQFVMCCNMGLLADSDVLEWGTSIRGAWFNTGGFIIEGCWMFVDGKQQLELIIKNQSDAEKFFNELCVWAGYAG